MKKEPDQLTKHEAILEAIMQALMQNGLKGTTMDSISGLLQMSKRTLYEIFGSKEEMFREAHIYFHKKFSERIVKIFEEASNVMEGIINCFLFNRDVMSNVSAEFIRDLEKFASSDHLISESQRQHHNQHFYDVLQKGAQQGYFREDVNLYVQCRMLTIQMEALKRTQELFSEEISLLEVYDSIIIGFLRGISSEKGLKEIEQYMPRLTSNSTEK